MNYNQSAMEEEARAEEAMEVDWFGIEWCERGSFLALS
jgi:hypothetical protein